MKIIFKIKILGHILNEHQGFNTSLLPCSSKA